MTIAFVGLLFFIFIPIALTTVPIVLSALHIIPPAIAESTLQGFESFLLWLVTIIIPLLFQIIVNRFFFFRRSWILYRPLYALYDYNLIFTNTIIGVAAIAYRFVMLFVFFVAFFARLDISSFPGPEGSMYVWDSGFGKWREDRKPINLSRAR